MRRRREGAARMNRLEAMDKTTEEIVNSITITEGPVQNMSLNVQKTSRTPYSDATKVRRGEMWGLIRGWD